jgi:hypothetical protein
MKRFGSEMRRRSIIPLLGLGLAAGYLFVFAPLNRKAEDLDKPLAKGWRKLAASLGQTNATQLDFVAITNQLVETKHANAALETARKQAELRVEPGESLRARMNEIFQLVEYDNEVEQRVTDLDHLAEQKHVVIEQAVFNGFPKKTAEVKAPELLWAELEFIDDLLTSAINCQVAAIHTLTTTPLTNAPPTNGVWSLAKLPVQLELSGPATNVTRFLQSLPLRGDELKAAGLPDAPTNKPALFVDRLVLRKESPDKPDDVHVSLRAVGFIFRQ